MPEQLGNELARENALNLVESFNFSLWLYRGLPGTYIFQASKFKKTIGCDPPKMAGQKKRV